MLADDRRLSLRMIAEELKISLDSVGNIIHEHLQKRKKKILESVEFLSLSTQNSLRNFCVRSIPPNMTQWWLKILNNCAKYLVYFGGCCLKLDIYVRSTPVMWNSDDVG
ncbi:hypothetical protein AVEN_175254-1 [Araneus ventricosus]|uniref:Uncharacterized protein n=1 Tax=Araneus ventricosus TaxID=182803 RepID=A0A4Y2F258_ARAVE|nr:hypothetical protein AVEN_175254-1 [Araneus ventricosus]